MVKLEARIQLSMYADGLQIHTEQRHCRVSWACLDTGRKYSLMLPWVVGTQHRVGAVCNYYGCSHAGLVPRALATTSSFYRVSMFRPVTWPLVSTGNFCAHSSGHSGTFGGWGRELVRSVMISYPHAYPSHSYGFLSHRIQEFRNPGGETW